MGMAFLLFRVVSVVTMIVAAAASTRYTVGDRDGWKMPEDGATDLYQTWASKITFQVGDSIVFQYRNDSVVRVDKRGYYHCNETSHGFKDGNTVITLDRAGFYYFVSGDIEHCKKGQRLMIQVPSTAAPTAAHGNGVGSLAGLRSFLHFVLIMQLGFCILCIVEGC